MLSNSDEDIILAMKKEKLTHSLSFSLLSFFRLSFNKYKCLKARVLITNEAICKEETEKMKQKEKTKEKKKKKKYSSENEKQSQWIYCSANRFPIGIQNRYSTG